MAEKYPYTYFVSFAQTKEDTHGFSHRIISFTKKPTINELVDTVIKKNPQFKEIVIINFKLLDRKELRICEVVE